MKQQIADELCARLEEIRLPKTVRVLDALTVFAGLAKAGRSPVLYFNRKQDSVAVIADAKPIEEVFK